MAWSYAMFNILGGQKIFNKFALKPTYYGLTGQRLLVVSGKRDIRVLACHFQKLDHIRLFKESNGGGTIHFGPKIRFGNPFEMEESPLPVLESVPNAVEVFKLICQTQDRVLRK